MNTKLTFGKLTFVAARVVAETGSGDDMESYQRFEEEWRADPTVVVRKFKRRVRAGGCSLMVGMIVVRRKAVQG